jgi:hypothetical protein
MNLAVLSVSGLVTIAVIFASPDGLVVEPTPVEAV